MMAAFLGFACLGLSLVVAALSPPGQNAKRATDRIEAIARQRSARSLKNADVAQLAKGRSLQFQRQVYRFFFAGVQSSWSISIPANTLIAVAIGTAAIVGVLSLTLAVPLAYSIFLAALLGFFVPRQLGLRQHKKATAKFGEQFTDTLDYICRLLRVGLPISAALDSASANTPEPTRTLLRDICDQTRIGLPLGDVLEAASKRVALPDFRFFAVAVMLQNSTGGNLAASLDILAQTIRRRRAIQRKAKALSGEARFSAYILGALPFFTIGALLFIQPDYLSPLFNDPRGHIIIAMSLAGLALSAFTISRMMRSVTQ